MTGETRAEQPFDMSKLEGDGTGNIDYYRERLQRRFEGEPTWIVRNFDSDHGRVYDFYVNGRNVGCVIHDYDDGCNAYVGANGETVLANDQVELSVAVDLLEAYALG